MATTVFDTPADSKQDKSDNTLTTTAKTVVGAINELDSHIIPFIGPNLSWNNNIDLDDMKTSGYYPIGSTGITHCPDNGWGILSVIAIRSDTIEQIYFNVNHHIYTRELRSGSWSSWDSFAQNSKLYYKNLGSFATEDALITALNTEIASMGNNTQQAINFNMSAATNSFLANYYHGTLSRGSAADYCSMLVTTYSNKSNPHDVIGCKNGTWGFNNLNSNFDIQSVTGDGNQTFYFIRSGRFCGCHIPQLSAKTLNAWENIVLCQLPNSFTNTIGDVYIVPPMQSNTNWLPVYIRVKNHNIELMNQSANQVTTQLLIPTFICWICTP